MDVPNLLSDSAHYLGDFHKRFKGPIRKVFKEVHPVFLFRGKFGWTSVKKEMM